MVLKIVLLVVFFAATIYIGYYCRRRAANVEGFVLGGRKVGPWMSAFAYGTSYFSAVIFIGYAGQFGWKFGMAAFWIGIGNVIIGSLAAWYVLGRRTRLLTHHLDAKTMPDFFGKRYKSPAIRTVSALIIFVFLIPYTASVYNGLSRLFDMAFGLPYEVCIIAMAVITCIYVVWGGYTATALNDTIQGTIMIFGIIAVIVAVLNGHGGWTESIIQLSQVEDPSAGSPGLLGQFTSMFGPDPLGLLFVVILTSLGVWGLPQMVQKFYAIESESAIRKGGIVSTFFALIVAGGSYFLGGFGRLFGDQIEYAAEGTPVYDSVVPTMLSNLPDILVGITVVLVLSASMSTLSSLVLTSSSTLTLDVIKPVFHKNMKPRGELVWMRVLLVIFVIISAVIALIQYNSSVTFIAQLMSISWGALAGSFIAPFLYGLYMKRTSVASVWVCFAFGVGLTVSNMFIGYISDPIAAGAIAMIGSLILCPLVSLFTPQMKREDVDEMFACYNKETTVPAKEALAQATDDAGEIASDAAVSAGDSVAAENVSSDSSLGGDASEAGPPGGDDAD